MSLFLEWRPLALAATGLIRSLYEGRRKAQNPLPWAWPVLALAALVGLWRSISVSDGWMIVVFSVLLVGTAFLGVIRATEYREAQT